MKRVLAMIVCLVLLVTAVPAQAEMKRYEMAAAVNEYTEALIRGIIEEYDATGELTDAELELLTIYNLMAIYAQMVPMLEIGIYLGLEDRQMPEGSMDTFYTLTETDLFLIRTLTEAGERDDLVVYLISQARNYIDTEE